MRKEAAMAQAGEKVDRSVTVNFYVPKDGDLKVDFGGLEIDQQVTVTLVGKVRSVSKSESSQDLGIKIKSLTIGGKDREEDKEEMSKIIARRRR